MRVEARGWQLQVMMMALSRFGQPCLIPLPCLHPPHAPLCCSVCRGSKVHTTFLLPFVRRQARFAYMENFLVVVEEGVGVSAMAFSIAPLLLLLHYMGSPFPYHTSAKPLATPTKQKATAVEVPVILPVNSESGWMSAAAMTFPLCLDGPNP